METSINNKCRAFTSLEQSKKLAEILPLESADMFYSHKTVFYNIMEHRLFVDEDDNWHLHQRSEIAMMDTGNEMPAWSLASLLGVLHDYTLQTNTDGTVFVVCESKKPMISDAYNNPIDACYEMIIHLHELKML